MFAKLFSRVTGSPAPHSAHDHLFTTYAPEGAPARVLCSLYEQYAGAYPDEPVPPQHRHYRALVDAIVAGGAVRSMRDLDLRRVNSAYVTCFEKAEAFEFQLSLWRNEPDFAARLLQSRTDVVADLTAQAEAEAARITHYARWNECLAAPLDIGGYSRISVLAQMQPDDWHEIALRWDWRDGTAELEWLTAQRACDRATALYVMCQGAPGDVATHREGRVEARDAFIRTLAARLEDGFYPAADLALPISMRTRVAFAEQMAIARRTRVSPWVLPSDLLHHEGRPHQPKYTVSDGRLHYQYEYWLAHVAPRR